MSETAQKISSTRLSLLSVRTTIAIFLRVIRRAWPILLFLHIIQFAASQFFSYATEYLRQTGREDILIIASVALFEFVFTMLWSSAWILAIGKHTEAELTSTPTPSFKSSMLKSFNHLLIEEVRSLAAVLWRMPLLLIPALTQYIRLTLVPFIVIFDPDYELGRCDALKASRRLSHGRFWLLAITAVGAFGTPLMIEQLAQGGGGEWVWENPLGVGVGTTGSFIADIFTTIFLFIVFRSLFTQEKVEEDAPIQLERS